VIVVDTNVLAYASIPGGATASALAVKRQDADWVAPPLWRSELRQVLAREIRFRGMSVVEALTAFKEAEALVVEPDFSLDTAEVLILAGSTGCSAYDCEFVALAQELGVLLVTGDRRLAAHFPAVAVHLESFVAS
jgi:predicted nucleic acid-binding protein